MTLIPASIASPEPRALFEIVPELAIGPSEMGWSKISQPMRCWRLAFLSSQVGQRGPRKALDIGLLTHKVLEWFYSGQRTEEEVLLILSLLKENEETREIAEVVHNLLWSPSTSEGRKYCPDVINEDLKNWDILFVEKEAGFTLKPRNHPAWWGKLERVTTRFDLVRKLPDGGVGIVETKTAGALSNDLTKGYTMDGQLHTQVLVWKKSGLERKYGPVREILMNILVKTKTPQHYRAWVHVSDGDVREFWRATKPWVEELYLRLARDKNKKSQWPKNYAACQGRYGLCQFFNECEADGDRR